MFFQKLRLIQFLGTLLEDVFIPFVRHAQSYLQPLQQLAKSRTNVPHKRTLFTKSSTISQRMPPQAWDCHMHVTSPHYPLAPNAAYTPSLHSLQHAIKFEKTIGISNIVLVQPSIYGNDNSCLLDALKKIGPRRGRGVVGIDPDTIELATLQEWHKLGVRGVRLNLKSTNAKFTEASLRKSHQASRLGAGAVHRHGSHPNVRARCRKPRSPAVYCPLWRANTTFSREAFLSAESLRLGWIPVSSHSYKEWKYLG
jgi:hypothetical protein